MKIGIMGTPVRSGNRGVLALGASLVNLCMEASEQAEVFLLLDEREAKPVLFNVSKKPCFIPVVNVRLSLRSRLREHVAWIFFMSLIYRLLPVVKLRSAIEYRVPWIRAVAGADWVGDIRGGDSFSDIYGMQRYVLAFLPVWSVVLVKGSIVQFPQTYGPFKNSLARWMARFLLKRSSTVIARDLKSQKVAQELLSPRRKVLLSPDVAFSLEVVEPDVIELDPPLNGSPRGKIIGLNVNGLMYHGGYTRNNMFGLKMNYPTFLQDFVPALLREHGGELWLIPHTFAADGNAESDPEACRRLREELPKELRDRIRIVTREYDQHEIKGIIGKCEFFVGSRMHACIGALSQGIPCVGVAYSMKFAGVFESVGMEDWVVDGRIADNSGAVQRILELYRRRDEVREGLTQRSEEARGELKKVFNQLMRSASAGVDA